jgi:inorganic pyrophosphatase
LDGRKDESVVAAPKDRQQDDDLRTLEAVLSQCPTTLAAQVEWCRQRKKSRASFFRAKRALEEQRIAGRTP